jgi:dihydroorotase
VCDFLCGLARRGIVERIDKEQFVVMATGAKAAVELGADSASHGQAAVRWRVGATGWLQQWVAQHVAEAFIEAYGGLEL